MSRDPRSVDWEQAWSNLWKPYAANVWFRHQAAVYARWIGPPPPAARVLKTDAFDEACGFQPFPSPSLVLMDVAPRILAEARRRLPGTLGCATDVRHLAFRDAAFDLVVSPSTLDHFDDAGDIDVALAELRRVLRPGGTLLVTLDNPANPILRIRHAIRRRTARVGRLAPYAVGRTLRLDALVAAAERAGFDVVARGWALHTPRIAGLWLGEWVARRSGRSGRALERLFGSIERRADRLPTRGLTGHYVVAVCRRPTEPDAQAPRATFGFPGSGAGVVGWKRAEARVRSAWVRRMPAPVLAVVDPPVRRSAAVFRRAAAIPLYLRQPIGVYAGSCAGSAARVVVWGKPTSPHFLPELLFETPPTVAWQAPRLLPEARRAAALHEADLLIAETTPALAPLFRRRGFLVVPEQVRFGASVAALSSLAARPSRSLESDSRVARRAGYRVEFRPYTTALGRRCFDGYIIPYAVRRFGPDARLPDFWWFDLLLRSGFVIEVVAPGGGEADAVGMCLPRGRVLAFVALGTRGGDPVIARAGAIHVLYEAVRMRAVELGVASIDVGRCRPWRQDGVARYKWKRGFRPIIDGAQTLEHAVRILRPENPVARRLGEAGLFVRAGRRIRVLQPDGTLGDD